MASKKIDLTGALEEILNRQKEAQEDFEESGRRKQLFRSDEEREADEKRLEEEPSIPLPIPEFIKRIKQSTAGNYQYLKRPDKAPDAWGEGPTRSTRVQAMQWVPLSPIDETGSSWRGYIFVAFARPSNLVGNSLWAYPECTNSQWESLKSSTSLGSAVKMLGSGSRYKDNFGKVCERAHKKTMLDEGESYSDWIFGPEYDWSMIRPNNEGIYYGERAARSAARKKATKKTT